MEQTLKSQLLLRKAALHDADLIYKWRNSAEVRRYSLNPAVLDHAKHIEWLQNALTNKHCVLLIAELNSDHPIGVLRYTVEHDNAEVSIFLNPNMIGKGLGSTILQLGAQWLKKEMPHIKQITAKILPENIASQKTFVQAGFHEYFTVYQQKL
jgi:UDP-2,4-diacetamido-2,4,6-trideoxy-beta-L-altropyranose hydrolase